MQLRTTLILEGKAGIKHGWQRESFAAGKDFGIYFPN